MTTYIPKGIYSPGFLGEADVVCQFLIDGFAWGLEESDSAAFW